MEDGKQMSLGRDFRIRILGSGELWASSAQVGSPDPRIFGQGLGLAGEGNFPNLQSRIWNLECDGGG